jgi:hypothetical protein
MPDLQTIETAMGQALRAVSGLGPIAWPNRTSEPSRPFVLFDHVPTGWNNVTLDGSETRAEGFILASVCVAQGGFANAAIAQAKAIQDAFPVGRRLGGVCVTQVQPLQGFFDGVGWRQPVRIEYRSET